MCTYIIVVLIIGFAAQCEGQSLPEGSTDRTTVCAETFLRGSCPFGKKIAVKDVQYGTSQCPLSSDASGCCDYDSADCLTDYTGTTQQAACSGRELCNDVGVGQEDTSSCGSPYPGLNHYLTMEYYCIPQSRISKMCESGSLMATGSPLYVWNNDYPFNLIRSVSTSCSCSVESGSCYSQIKVYFVHFELGDGGGLCNGNQNMRIDDNGSAHTYTCSQNTNYEITTMMTSTSSYITVTLDNAAGISDGKFWLGFEATESTAQLQIDCPATAQENCKDCSSLEDPSDGTVTVPTTNYQSVATFSCNTGFTLFGSATRECQIDGTWSNENPTCFINDCGSLSAPGNGMVAYSSGTTFQSVATFSCDTGYTLVGVATRTCQADTSWSNSDPSCQINDCGSLNAPTNGLVTYSSGTTFQSLATFICDTGYTLVGDATRTCQAYQSWSNNNPSCHINDCGSLNPPANGSVTYTGGTTFHSVAIFKCDTGYTLVGDSTRTCQADTSWSNGDPSCQINDCGSQIAPANGSVTYSSGTTFQSVATFICDTGYTLVGDATRTCQADKSWSNGDPSCKINDCGSLSAPANGLVTYSSWTTFQSVATFSCNTGYTLEGDATRKCQANALWSNSDPSCNLNDGVTVTTPALGSVTNSSGTTFKISCSIWFSVAVLFKSVTVL